MMNFLIRFSLTTMLTLNFIGCSQMKRQMKKEPSPELSDLMESVDIEDNELKMRKTGETNHEFAEADVNDSDIKNKVGTNDIDEDINSTEEDGIPYAKNFLIKKNTKRTQFWIDYFTKHQKDRFQRFINNGEEYRHHIEAILKEHGLPKELYFVGLIESGYYLGAKSHASAVGPWQFIRGTGKRYGLKINSEIDERQDLFKATHAAAMYFKDLHNVFSSWELALSAYNAGEYGIIRRIMKHGTRDFYKLSKNKQLPSETINYVPKVMAAMHVFNNAKKYGLIIPKKNHRLFDRTELRAFKKNVPLKLISNRLNINLNLLRKLNPELKGNTIPRSIGTYYLRIPQNKYAYNLESSGPETTSTISSSRPESRKETIRKTASIEKKSIPSKPKIHIVKRGEGLIEIAKKYSITPKKLAQINSLTSWRTTVRIGQRLSLVEQEDSSEVKKSSPVKVSNGPIVYKVKAGDNLTDLAKLFNVKVSKIKKANKLKSGKILSGQKIVLPDTQKGIYTVKRGDHLSKVAKEFNQEVEMLIKLNSLKRKKIYPGQKIIVNID